MDLIAAHQLHLGYAAPVPKMTVFILSEEWLMWVAKYIFVKGIRKDRDSMHVTRKKVRQQVCWATLASENKQLLLKPPKRARV